MASKKRGRKHRISKSKKSGRITRRSLVVDTMDAWLSTQEKKRKPVGEKKKGSERTVPNTMANWLKAQKPVFEEGRIEITFPLNSTEQWLRSQVETRQSQKDLVEEKVEIALEETNLGEVSTVPHSSE